MNMKLQIKAGMSLVEILIAVSIFAIIGVLATRSLTLSITGAKKSDSLVRVRENINLPISVIERQLRNAESIDCNSSTYATLSYISSEGIASSFSCTGTHIASNSPGLSVRLTSEDITLTTCSFNCTQIDSNEPPIVKINLTAEDNTSTGKEKATVTTVTEIVARNF